jgi:hypothetical protein
MLTGAIGHREYHVLSFETSVALRIASASALAVDAAQFAVLGLVVLGPKNTRTSHLTRTYRSEPNSTENLFVLHRSAEPPFACFKRRSRAIARVLRVPILLNSRDISYKIKLLQITAYL